MRLWTVLGVVGVAGMTMTAGCASNGDAAGARGEGETAIQPPAAAEPVEILQQARGDSDALADAGVRLIKDASDLAALGVQDLAGLQPDWDTQDVVLLTLGEQPTGGYWAQITGAQLVGDVLYVQGIANRPAEDAAATQALTYPYAAAVIRETRASRALSDIESVQGQQPPQN